MVPLPQPGRSVLVSVVTLERGYAGGGPAYSFSLRDLFILSKCSPGTRRGVASLPNGSITKPGPERTFLVFWTVPSEQHSPSPGHVVTFPSISHMVPSFVYTSGSQPS